MQQERGIPLQAFRKNADNSWTCIQVADVRTPAGDIRLNPGITFKKGATICGADIADMLEKNSNK